MEIIKDARIIVQYFPNISDHQKQLFTQLSALYEEWNTKINVVSRKDIDNIYTHHILHSLSIAKIIHFKPNTNIIDIGTGGGFPGIPLAIMFPQAQFTLIDSIGKKIKVVESIAKELQLTNIIYQQIRAEDMNGKWDFVLSRGVTNMHTLTQWVKKKINTQPKHEIPNGIFCFKGGEIEEELSHVEYPWIPYDITDFFYEEYFKTKKIIHISL
ncbi:MAG: 16S rRNA (guanine(527)-N(7))-methyltransferase RsmG [Chitinophagaceae bacterium]|nr:16S rRNA (guanine(527)-N(7))-methyltransferase RsmG [Chitinophagaceae bacterium]